MEATLGHHATGRSAAMFLQTYGGADVRAFTVASRPFLEAAPAEFESELLRPRGLLQIARSGRGPAVQALFDEVSQVLADVSILDEVSARTLCPILREGAVEACLYEPSAMEMDVDALHQGYVRGFRSRGGAVRWSARVQGLSRTADTWEIALADGTSVSAPTVVNAAGAWVDEVAVAAGLSPIGFTPRRRSAFTTAAPDGVAVDRLPMLYDIDESFYVKPEGEQMLCSPADKTPSDPVDARADTLEIARALDEIREVTTLRTFSPDENLVIGADPMADGFFWLAGQGGYGVQTAPALARYAAAGVLGDEVPADVLALGLDPQRVSPARFDGAA
jgi:D-arginine dehydrogenase